MFAHIRQRLGWKLFLSYLVIILVGIIVLATSTKLIIPSAFDHHLAAMMPMMADSNMGMMETSKNLEVDLFTSRVARRCQCGDTTEPETAGLHNLSVPLVSSWSFSE